MYGLQGEHRLTEIELPWLPGYEESRPVRIGNGAYDQFQLDAYGMILKAFYDGRIHGLPPFPGAWESLADIMDVVEKRWKRPDEGIWEIRSDRKHHFTYSKVMAWVAADRTIRLVEEFGVDADSRKVQQPQPVEGAARRDAYRDPQPRVQHPRGRFHVGVRHR
jgi:GH15 family glucan-1,4-alpha-glucosidase